MAPKLLPKLTPEEWVSVQEQNSAAVRASIATQRNSDVRTYDNMAEENPQMPEHTTEEATAMQQQPGMPVPAGLNIDWTGFTGQALADQSSFATPTGTFDSPCK